MLADMDTHEGARTLAPDGAARKAPGVVKL
jgi:hypothetical protein